MSAELSVQLDGQTFVWNGSTWYGASDYTIPSFSVALRLREAVKQQFGSDDCLVSDPEELLARAKQALVLNDRARAERLARQVLDRYPAHEGYAAAISGILRELDKSEEALLVTGRFATVNYRPVLTSRAAALCDLGRWEEGLATLEKAMVLGSDEHTELVLCRIRARAPELFH